MLVLDLLYLSTLVLDLLSLSQPFRCIHTSAP
jgi:hypothetical protein